MNIRQMQVFQAVCQEGSFTKAAVVLHMTQPAVSHVILDLEAEIGTALFERISRKTYITEPGKKLLSKVTALLAMYESVQDSVGTIGRGGRLKIGSSITIANFWLPQLVAAFQHEYPDITVSIQVDRAANIETLLMKNEVDIGFLEGTVRHEELVAETFSSYEMEVFFSPAHPFLQNTGKQITVGEFIAQRLLLREKGSAIRDTLDSALMLQNMYVKPMMTSVNSQALIQAAKSGIGVTVLPRILLEREIAEGELCSTSIRDMPLVNSNSVAYHKDKYMTSAIDGMLRLTREFGKGKS